jgi:putative flippase GtrA
MGISGFIGEWWRRLTERFPPRQFGRYLVVGAGNTLFSYAVFTALTAILTPFLPYAYVFASVLGNLIGITFSYLTYKFFIFKTKGNYFREWMRCVAVYSGAGLLGVAFLPVLVFLIRGFTSFDSAAPYIGGAIIAGLSVIASFIGHSNFTFRSIESPKQGIGTTNAEELR